MSNTVNCKFYKMERVGKRVKSTKLKFMWYFDINDKSYDYEFFVSALSHKRKVVCNGKTIEERTVQSKEKNYIFITYVKSYEIKIQQRDSTYIMYIDGQDFSHLMANPSKFIKKLERKDTTGNTDELGMNSPKKMSYNSLKKQNLYNNAQITKEDQKPKEIGQAVVFDDFFQSPIKPEDLPKAKLSKYALPHLEEPIQKKHTMTINKKSDTIQKKLSISGLVTNLVGDGKEKKDLSLFNDLVDNKKDEKYKMGNFIDISQNPQQDLPNLENDVAPNKVTLDLEFGDDDFGDYEDASETVPEKIADVFEMDIFESNVTSEPQNIKGKADENLADFSIHDKAFDKVDTDNKKQPDRPSLILNHAMTKEEVKIRKTIVINNQVQLNENISASKLNEIDTIEIDKVRQEDQIKLPSKENTNDDEPSTDDILPARQIAQPSDRKNISEGHGLDKNVDLFDIDLTSGPCLNDSNQPAEMNTNAITFQGNPDKKKDDLFGFNDGSFGVGGGIGQSKDSLFKKKEFDLFMDMDNGLSSEQFSSKMNANKKDEEKFFDQNNSMDMFGNNVMDSGVNQEQKVQSDLFSIDMGTNNNNALSFNSMQNNSNLQSQPQQTQSSQQITKDKFDAFDMLDNQFSNIGNSNISNFSNMSNTMNNRASGMMNNRGSGVMNMSYQTMNNSGLNFPNNMNFNTLQSNPKLDNIPTGFNNNNLMGDHFQPRKSHTMSQQPNNFDMSANFDMNYSISSANNLNSSAHPVLNVNPDVQGINMNNNASEGGGNVKDSGKKKSVMNDLFGGLDDLVNMDMNTLQQKKPDNQVNSGGNQMSDFDFF